MVSFVLAVTLLPAALVLRDRRARAEEKWALKQQRKAEKQRQSPIDAFLARVAVLSEHHRRVVFAVSLFLILGSAVFGLRLTTEADVFKMLPEDMPYVLASQKVNDYFGGQDVTVTLVSGDILEPAILESMLAYEEGLASNEYVGERGEKLFQREKIYSIADVVMNYNGSIPAGKGEVMEVLLRLQQASGSGQSASSNQLITEDMETALVSIRLDRGNQQDMQELADTIDREAAAATAADPGIAMRSSGVPLLIDEMLGTIVPTQIKTTTLALVLCALIVIIVFRSFFFGMAAASVVFISVAMELGALSLLGWPLDFMTVMVSSLVIGAGIDFGIHVTHRFMEEWRGGGVEIDEAIRRTVGNVGKALISAAVTTAGAFFILAFSKIGYMQRFGIITALSLVFALLSSLLILPSILAWRAQCIEKKAKESSRTI
jgi:predicted RND superfamily exporter protein